MRYAILSSCLAAALIAGGCRGDRPESPDSLAADTAAAQASAAAAAPAPVAVVTAAELAAFEQGLVAELDSIRAAQERKAAATTGRDSLSAVVAASEGRTIPAGALAAGIPELRYREIRRWTGELVRARGATATMKSMASSVDTNALPPDLRARVRDNMLQLQQMKAAEERAYDGMTPEQAKEVRAHVPRLDTLWNRLVAARLTAGR